MERYENLPDIRVHADLLKALHLAENTVYKTYLEDLNSLDIIDCPQNLQSKNLQDIAQFYRLEKFVHEKNENNRDKLVSIFHSVAGVNGSVIVLIISNGKNIEFYIGTKIIKDNSSADILEKTFKGNFPGSIIEPVNEGDELNALTARLFGKKNPEDDKQQYEKICTVTGVAGFRAKEESKEKQFVQGIEKLIDAMREESYSLILIADPVSSDQINVIRRGYENLYSQLATFATTELNYGQNESKSVSDSISEGLSKSISDSISDTISHTDGSAHTIGGGIHAGIGIPGGAYVGGGVNYSYSRNKSDSVSYGSAHSLSRIISSQKTKSDSKTEGESRSLQIKFEDKTIKNLLERIDLQLKRLNNSTDTGMWNCSVYCLAELSMTAKMAASAYLSLLRGENSSVETGAVTTWKEYEKIIPYLKKMHHPLLNFENKVITPASLISSTELSIHAGIPQKSVGGLPVLEMASFGREVTLYRQDEKEEKDDKKIPLGIIYHMGSKEDLPVFLGTKSLCSHTFITGSTGSGKSNAIYSILKELVSSDIPFLVIEPAKGEYKHAFGNRENVSVYGTNPNLGMMLKINPFKFNKGIHILEHLDRLIEIFNVCWPMYAAMPAVLKQAVERSYEQAGWDLQTSTNKYDDSLFPSFKDVCAAIMSVINSSEYSEENKGNYKGALVTRLNSLTNGLNGLIFTNDEKSEEEFFDEKTIVDLSRVGSMETKALIMGILVMKLQEYRMTSKKIDSPLRHVTVLEEAHNLLKRTSTEQSSDTANLLGKSVEMLANSIAEMRTYGEGFIIADQSPGLLDMSVIRNTNTKIILRLPDQGDRELVGKAAGLSDDQIVELAKLQLGVAAVYQNDWIQPVLCKITEFKKPQEQYKIPADKESLLYTDSDETIALKKKITKYLLSNILHEPPELDGEKAAEFRDEVLSSQIDAVTKARICEFLSKNHPPPKSIEPLVDIIGGLYACSNEILDKVLPMRSLTPDWAKSFCEGIFPSIHDENDFNWEAQKNIMQCIAIKLSSENARLKDLPYQLPKAT